MNAICLIGRLTKDPELRQTDGGSKLVKVCIAVRRPFANNGQYQTDFFDIISFNQTADFIMNYCHKGDMISVSGCLLTSKYTNKNTGVTTTQYYIQSNDVSKCN